jgi:hypothetical protein
MTDADNVIDLDAQRRLYALRAQARLLSEQVDLVIARREWGAISGAEARLQLDALADELRRIARVLREAA